MNAVYINVPLDVAIRCAQGTQTLDDRKLLTRKLEAAVKRSESMDRTLSRAYMERARQDGAKAVCLTCGATEKVPHIKCFGKRVPVV